MVKTQLVDPLGRNIGGIPTPTITNVPKSNTIQFGGGDFSGGGANGTWGTQENPAPTPVPAVPAVVPAPVAQPLPVNAPVAVPEYQLPESVTGVKPYISPTLQAKIDAKKTPITPVQPTPAPVTTEEVVTPVVEPVKPVETKPVEVAPVAPAPVTTPVTPELTDIEKQAQATGVKYTMVNGLPEYEPTNKEEALKILQSGGKFSAENSMTAVAKANLDKYRKYAQMTDTQLAQNIVNGNVSSRELEQITSINPDLVAKAKDMARKSTITDTANTIQVANDSIVKGEDTQVQNKALTNLLTKLGELDANAESYGDIKARVYANYPDMEVARGEIVNAQTQLRQLQRAKRDLFDDYRKKNSDLPISMIMAGYSALSKGIDDQIYEVNDTLSQNVALYNSYLDEAKSEIDFEIGQQGKEEQRLWDIYGVTSKEQIRQEDIEREDARIEQSIQLEEARYQRDIERDDMKSAQERKYKIEDMKNEMNMNIETGLMNLGVDPTGMTPEEMKTTYSRAIGKQILESKVIPTKWEKTTTTDVDGNEVEVFFDPNTGETRSPSELRGVIFGDTPGNSDVGALSLLPGQDLLAVPNETIVETRLKEVSPQNAKIRGKECAEYVNDVFQQSLFGNTIADKLRVAKDKNGTIGSAAVWTPSGSGEYGHVGIIVDEDENNWYIKSSNLKAGTVTTDKVPKSSIKGYYTTPEVKAYQPQQVEKVSNLTLSDISTFNNSTYKPQAEKDKGTKQKYQSFLEEKSAIMKDKKADIYDIMEFSQGGKDLTDSDSKTITKFSQALDQIDGIQKQVKDMKTGPILGRLKDLNPYDTKAQVLSASLNALIPNLARGVYGEVGVLTDNDIRQYAKTIPNLKQTNDVNNAVLALTLDTIAGGYKRQLQTLAAAGKDVSGFAGLYESIKAQADSIKSSIPGFNTDISQEDELEALSIR